MTASDLARADLVTLGGLIARKEVSPVEVMGATLARIERQDGELNAFISRDPDAAIAAARAAEQAIMADGPVGPLHGIPVAVKDLFLVAGMQRTCGSAAFEEAVASIDATSVARLKAAGAIVVGLANLHEFAFGPTGINRTFGSARNPWDRARVCGGSSSGSGCAVAASLVPAALGTDTGGSIRIPASLCGIVGLKQTFGLASRHGIQALSATLDHGGPLTRTVADCALVLQAIAGADRADPTTWQACVGDYSAGLGATLRGKRVAVPAAYYFDRLHPDVAAAIAAALTVFADLGAVVTETALPDAAATTAAWNTIALAESYHEHAAREREHGAAMGPDVRARLLLGADITTDDLVAAQYHRHDTQRQMAALFDDFDVVALPATPIPAVPIADPTIEVAGESIDGVRALGRLTRLAPLIGLPAMSLPAGFTADGLPVGLQLIGNWFAEADLLSIAHAFEQATPWHDRRPTEPA